MTPLRAFLSRAPVPRSVRVVLAEGEPVTIAVGANRKRWADVEGAIAPDAVRVEALDVHGAVMRAHVLADADDAPAPRSSASAAPSTPLELARIVLEASDAGAKRHAAAYETTMRELVGLVRVIADQHASAQRRLAQLESAWHRAIVRGARDASDDAPAASGLDELILPLLAGAMGGGGTAPANGKAKDGAA